MGASIPRREGTVLEGGELEDRVVLVTGGSRGIGRAVTLEAASRRARVAFCARTLGPEAVAVREEAERRSGPGRALAVAADVSREHDVETLFDAVGQAFGRVDVVVSNAGATFEGLLVTLSSRDWDAAVATNLTSSFLVARRAVREFLRGGGGRLIFMGSVLQYGGRGNAAYAASKGGLAGLSRAIAWEYGRRGVWANVVVAGYVDTDMTRHATEAARRAILEICPQRRFASPEEIARVVLFLASGRCAVLNGEEMHASAGLMDVSL